MRLSPIHTKSYIRDAIKDERLRNAVEKATGTAVDSRKKMVSQIPYWEDLRCKLHNVKKEVIDHPHRYLEEFESNCLKNGFHVHWASDGEEARKIILGIAQSKDIKKIVKSKSLTTEEIHLNPVFIENGIETIETDLGEYIVQLTGQIPSHLTMPALHLSRKDIGMLFHEKLGEPYTEEPDELLRIARKKLREHFLTADMGISGVNFAIADAGVLCIVENEANAHLTTCLPEIHVAVMGIEKLLPDFSALPYFLKALAPSATGQKSSTYVNFIGNAGREKYGEGPREVHIVLLDNGRTQILKNPHLRETLFCIRCGACLNACPVYQQTGGHAYGWVYMGPIGITLIPQYLGISEGRYAPFLSSLCGACYDVCPVRINIPRHLLTLRNSVVESGYAKAMERTGMSLWAFLARHPVLYRFITWFPGKLQKVLPGKTAFPVPGYGKERSFARFDSLGFRKRFYKLKE